MEQGMSFKGYLWSMLGGTVVSWLAWLVVLWRVDPDETGWLGLLLFFLTLFVGLVGTLALVGLSYRVFIQHRHEVIVRQVRQTFRQGIILATVLVASLALSAHDWLHWWVILIILILSGLIEYLILSYEHKKRV